MKNLPSIWLPAVAAVFAAVSGGTAADWPQWRFDAGRTAVSPDPLPAELHLAWSRQLPPLKPAFRNPRLQFDAGYEPIVVGNRLLVGSSANDSVTAYDAATGRQQWRFFAEGPVRLAPAAWRDRILFGSDDGHLYCLDAAGGQLCWKFRAVPSSRKILGNGRLISVWPVRGGPVVADDVVYFAAGVWPFEGVFVYALKAETGEVVWRADRLGYLYGQQPHAAEALAGLTPQGYLVVNGDDLVVPCGSAFPAVLNRKTGTLMSFELPKPGRLPGGWFAAVDPATARDVRRGEIVVDQAVNTQRHEDKVYTSPGRSQVRSSITVGGEKLHFDEGIPGVPGTVYSLLAAQGRLFVVTREGGIFCFGGQPVPEPTVYAADTEPAAEPKTAEPEKNQAAADQSAAAKRLVEWAGSPHGYALVWGLQDGRLLDALARVTQLQVIGADPDAGLVARLRNEFNETGRYGSRVSLFVGDPGDLDFPPYLANLITSETPNDFDAHGATALRTAFRSLRPYGGVLCLASDEAGHRALAETVGQLQPAGAEVSRHDGWTVIRRTGPLPGATNYLGGWQPSDDALVRAPLGILWFDDTLGHFKRSPQPKFIDGVMVSYLKDWLYPREAGAAGDYPLLGPVLSDVYTGRVLSDDEAVDLRRQFPRPEPGRREPPQYRPPAQRDPWKPDAPRAGRRVNPLTGVDEPRTFPKSYGCDGGFDYGSLYTMRSATAAFYDKTNESGTINISGPRSGCTNSIIPACGLLNLPYFYEGCTCSYPLPTGAALVPKPETFEQWTAWGPGTPTDIQRIGINFGAPGDRVTRGGTLWLDYPSVGGPSPEIDVQIRPGDPAYDYQHSVWMEGGSGWSWVTASGVERLESFELGRLKPGSYTVRLYFAERAGTAIGERIQNVSLQGEPVLRDFDIVAAAGGSHRGVVRELPNIQVDGRLMLELSARQGVTRICGIELIRNGLEVEPLP